MNRRSFVTSMLAAAVAPMVLKGAGRTWSRTDDLWIPNPDYSDAPFEVIFLSTETCAKESVVPLIAHRITMPPIPSGYTKLNDPWPMRFDAEKNLVPPFLIKRQ